MSAIWRVLTCSVVLSGCGSGDAPQGDRQKAAAAPIAAPAAPPDAGIDGGVLASGCVDMDAGVPADGGIKAQTGQINAQNIASSNCPAAQCGGNSPYVNLFPVVGVAPSECSNFEGVKLTTVTFAIDSQCKDAKRLGVALSPQYGWELLGLDNNGKQMCSGRELLGTNIAFGRGKVSATAIVTRVGLLETLNGQKVDRIAYVLRSVHEAPSYGASRPAEWGSLCGLRSSLAFREKLDFKTPKSVVKALSTPALGRSGRQDDQHESALAVGEPGPHHPAPGLQGHSKTGLPKLTDSEVAEAVVILPGEIYDGYGEYHLDQKGGSAGWYNFACLADSLAKVSVIRGVKFGNNGDERTRQAAVRAEAGIYCKGDPKEPWQSRTIRGVALKLKKTKPSDQTAQIEGRWNETGLTCLTEPRIFSGGRIVQDAVLPAGCGDAGVDCWGAGTYREELNKACGNPVDAGLSACAQGGAGGQEVWTTSVPEP